MRTSTPARARPATTSRVWRSGTKYGVVMYSFLRADRKACTRKTRSGCVSLAGVLARPVWMRPVGPPARESSWVGKNRWPSRISPDEKAQASTNADCRVRARGPVTRTIMSRQCSSVSASPNHLSATASPPVKPTRPSITIARRWLRL